MNRSNFLKQASSSGTGINLHNNNHNKLISYYGQKKAIIMSIMAKQCITHFVITKLVNLN